ncbi:MAG: DUF167 domain-containing protein [Actinobacteria bacterium]|nr:DUF167 domain-containing protein [Actinomycetota bacterium]
MLHGPMASITVRIVPRASRTSVERREDGSITVRVRAAPEGGRATEEACRALAAALGVPRSDVRLRAGGRSRTKVFSLEGLLPNEMERRVQAL